MVAGDSGEGNKENSDPIEWIGAENVLEAMVMQRSRSSEVLKQIGRKICQVALFVLGR
jgi:hypothetical protein